MAPTILSPRAFKHTATGIRINCWRYFPFSTASTITSNDNTAP